MVAGTANISSCSKAENTVRACTEFIVGHDGGGVVAKGLPKVVDDGVADGAAESLGEDGCVVVEGVVMFKNTFQEIHEPSGGVADVPADYVPDAVRDWIRLGVCLLVIIGGKDIG